MTKLSNKIRVSSAVKGNSRTDLSFTHLTTLNFGEIIPALCCETILGDRIPVRANYFSRTAPLVVPTYGKFNFKVVRGFVPLFQVATDADAYVAGKQIHEGNDVSTRTFTYATLMQFLIDTVVSTDVTTEHSSNPDTYFDFNCTDVALTRRYYRFTTVGKYYYKVLVSLGYAIPSNANLAEASPWYQQIGTKKLSAYPLLAFAKMYNDYFSQSQRYNTSALSTLLNSIRYDRVFTGSYQGGQLLPRALMTILSNIKLSYDPDYFVDAWQSPNRPLADVNENVNTITPPGVDSDMSVISDRDSVRITKNGQPITNIPTIATDFADAFASWVRRNSYSGSKAVETLFSRMGIKTEDFRSNYAHIIGSERMPIQVGDITSTAQTAEADLGEYAGKAIMSGNGQFSYDCKDYGFLFEFAYVTVKPMYAYGFDKSVLRVEPFDFYNPEFDGIGPEAISAGEVFANPRAADEGDTSLDNVVYGFSERYNSYRFHRDVISGDFRKFGDNEMNAWHSGRLLNKVRKEGQMVAQSSSMVNLDVVNSEYNRIFSQTDGEEDKFYMAFVYEIDAMRPILSHNETPRLGKGDLQVDKNGEVIS